MRTAYRLELALQNRSSNLAYKENLFSPEGSPGDSTFKRSPTGIMVFDFKSRNSFPFHPDGFRLVSRALEYHLRDRGRLTPVDEGFRNEIFRKIKSDSQDLQVSGGGQSTGSLYMRGIYYKPEYISRIEEQEKNKSEVEYVVGGEYRSGPRSVEVTYKLYQKSNGRLLDSFTYSARGQDAIHDVSARAARRLAGKISYISRVVKIGLEEIYLNSGSIDGVQKGDRFLIFREGRLSGDNNDAPNSFDARLIQSYIKNKKRYCKVKQIARYVSSCVPAGDLDLINPGDLALEVPEKMK